MVIEQLVEAVEPTNLRIDPYYIQVREIPQYKKLQLLTVNFVVPKKNQVFWL
jgi:hypothetical protein